MDEEIRHCDQCGCELNEDDGTWVDGDLLCQECVDAYCVRCDHCDEIIWQSNAVEDDDTTLCPDCYENHYYRCECCGRIMRDSYVNWQSDLPYCDGCFEEFDDEIEQYNYKPEPQFYGSGERFFGIELEVDEGGKDDDNAKTLKAIANEKHEHIYIKTDGSLDDGFEIVSHPMTLDYHMYSMDWEGVLHEAVRMGYPP